MNYKVRVKEVESIRVAYIKYHGKVENANKIFPTVFKSIKGNKNGPPFFKYLNFDKESKVGDIELSVPTLENPTSDNVLIKILPPVKVLSTVHKGSYETIFNAYKAIEDYALEENIVLSPVFKEIFIKGPGMILKGNPKNYITEIQFVIKRD